MHKPRHAAALLYAESGWGHLAVVLLEMHLHVQAHKLSQVPVCVRLLRSEDGRNLTHI